METGRKVAKKRERSENWLSEDKYLLMELVRERVAVIENKNTDTNTNSKKQAAWADLLNSFNSMCKGSKRILPQLKSQWGIIKMHEKRLKSLERKQIIATGGGPPPQLDPLKSEDISAWLPNEFVIDTNEFDSDQINQVKVGGLSPDEIILEVHQEDGITEEILPITNENDQRKKEGNENKVESALTNRLIRKKKNKKKENENKTSAAANAIASVEIDCRRELHRAQMDNEKRIARNLDLEEILIKKKIEYYEKNK
ncbi:uncharacterized protein LOC123864545 isoform X3 [Maniola jurtina]|uniref:uncharacterized protein LOC123864544 isoform X3 n=2 Tax=Maniola jurtina TaxID=191418 RepID=UPI001E68EB21|nr:uncharacterized protein LOC123864544 isoform X3 [Maniola jurtina]XP_045761041.1 uncharacterized protein LOC123864545 isoform X3 [Maniola jurtina]